MAKSAKKEVERSALIENGVVVNVAVGLPDGYVECGADVGIGWNHKSGKFTKPDPAPDGRDYRQKRAAEMPELGDTLDEILRLIDSLDVEKTPGIQEKIDQWKSVKEKYQAPKAGKK